MKYEKPEMEIVELIKQSVIITSPGEGGTATEGDGPGVDWT